MIKIDKSVEEEYQIIIPLIEEDQNVTIQVGYAKDLKKDRVELDEFDDNQKVIFLLQHILM